MNEEWREIFDGRYAVSTLGRVKRVIGGSGCQAGKILKAQYSGNGYLHVRLSFGSRASIKIFLVHRLVAHAFLGPCPEGEEVNHIDSNRSNPRLDNLEYVTRSQNHIHALRHGFQVPHRPKLTYEKVAGIRLLLDSHVSLAEIGRFYDVSPTLIRYIREKRIWNNPSASTAANLDIVGGGA